MKLDAPLLKRTGAPKTLNKTIDSLNKVSKFAKRFGIRARHIIVRENAVKKLILIQHGVTKQQPIKPRPPGVVAIGGKTARSAVIFIHSPANTALFNPATNQLKLTGIQRKAAAHWRRGEQIEKPGGCKTASRQSQQLQHRRSYLPLIHHPPVSNGVMQRHSTISCANPCPKNAGDVG